MKKITSWFKNLWDAQSNAKQIVLQNELIKQQFDELCYLRRETDILLKSIRPLAYIPVYQSDASVKYDASTIRVDLIPLRHFVEWAAINYAPSRELAKYLANDFARLFKDHMADQIFKSLEKVKKDH